MKAKKGSGWNIIFVVIVCLLLFGAMPKEETPAADTWPTKTIRLIVSVAPGGQVDTTIRGLVPPLRAILGTPVVVENMAGAGGRIATQYVYDAAPDGYVLLATNASDVSMGEVAYKTRYRTEEFTYIGSYCHEGAALIVSKGSGIKSVEELIAASKKKPINYGAVHLASQNHMCSYFLAKATGLKANIVPYSGGGPIIADLLGNHIQTGLVGLSLGVRAHMNGQVVMIAQLSGTRSKIAKDFPAIKELYPSYKGSNYTFGIMAPPKLPDNIKNKLVAAYQEAIKSPEFQKWADSAFLDIKDIGPEAFKTLMVNDKALYTSLIDIVEELKKATEAKPKK